MIKRVDLRFLVVLLVNLGYAYAVSSVNNWLSPYVYLMLPALFIVPAAKWLGTGGLIFVVLVSSLASSTFVPLPMGIVSIIWLLAAAFARVLCANTEKVHAVWAIGVMEIVNFSILFLYAVFLPSAVDGISEYILRVACDILASALALFPLSKWAVEFPDRIIRLFEPSRGEF